MKYMQLCAVIILALIFSTPSFSQQEVLLVGSSFSKKLLKNEKHVYAVTLEKGGYAELVVMQKGVDLAVDVTDPAGKKIGYFDSPNGTEGSEPVTISASAKGKYQIHIYPLIDEPQMSDSEKIKWADQNQGAYDMNDVRILSAKAYQQRLAKEKADKDATIKWLTENAHPLNSLAAGNGFEDLQWLKSVLQDVRFVGIGTSTAGTREFFQIRNRMLEFLVNEMGFTGFAVGTSYAVCKIVNDYVSRGKGDINTVLSSLGFWLNTEEMKDMIEWTRSFNQNEPGDKKIKFVGFDVGNYSRMAGAQQVEDYLKKTDPVLAQAKAGLFKFILEGVDFTMKNADSCKKECNNLLLSMQMSRGNYIQASSEKEYEEAVQYVTVIAQFFDANYMPDSDPRKTQRDWNSYYSVSNFNWLIQQEKPGTKF